MKLYYVPYEEILKIDRHSSAFVDICRINALYMIQNAGSGHIGSAFSAMEIYIDLLVNRMKPNDVLISSKGHDCAALYSILTAIGTMPFDKIHTFRRLGGLDGHPNILDGYSLFNTGSLGMGLSKAMGLAEANRRNGKDSTIYVVMGDGELEEGQSLESFCRLDNYNNVKLIIDYNKYQLSGSVEIVSGGLNGIVENTIKGKGVSFMEGNNKYHAGALTADEYQKAFDELYARVREYVTAVEVEREPRNRSERANILVHEYEAALADIGKDKNLIVLDADLEPDCGLTQFKTQYPDRFIQCGIAEQHMVSMASGLAAGGFIPIVHSFAAFLCRRANEQIYNLCTEGRKAVFVGAMAGILPPGPGLSHQCLHDVELMKTMPRLTILDPTYGDVAKALKHAIYEATGPVYIRLKCLPTVEGMRQ